MKVYLAGPEVFFPDAEARTERKRALAREFGFTPVTGEMPSPWPDDPQEMGVAIFRANEDAMKRADLCIANITPFRGLSADVGTVWELGFCYALGKPCFAYSADPRTYTSRVEAWAEAPLKRDSEGVIRLENGEMVEEHGMSDNLMIDASLALCGLPPVLGTGAETEDELFRTCLSQVAARLL